MGSACSGSGLVLVCCVMNTGSSSYSGVAWRWCVDLGVLVVKDVGIGFVPAESCARGMSIVSGTTGVTPAFLRGLAPPRWVED
jgi:hypothetical protein